MFQLPSVIAIWQAAIISGHRLLPLTSAAADISSHFKHRRLFDTAINI